MEVIVYSGLDKYNKDKRLYKTNVFDPYLGKDIYGQLQPIAVYSSVDLIEVSHQIKNLRIKDRNVVGDLVVLDTPKGKILKQLIDDKVAFDFKLRGYIDLTSYNIVFCMKLIAIDCGPNDFTR